MLAYLKCEVRKGQCLGVPVVVAETTDGPEAFMINRRNIKRIKKHKAIEVEVITSNRKHAVVSFVSALYGNRFLIVPWDNLMGKEGV